MHCCSLIFSYSAESSSLRRMSCVPRMSRSLTTTSNSFCCLERSASASLMIWLSLATSALNSFSSRAMSSSFLSVLLSSSRRDSRSCTTFIFSKCSRTSDVSLVWISSLSCSIWRVITLNLRFISAISSCDSIKFFAYRFRSERTAS